MFDLTAFIQQLLPPHRRTALTMALTRILFAPGLTTMASMVSRRRKLLIDSQLTGQVLALEEALRRNCLANEHAAEGYRIEDYTAGPAFDFTVVYPSDSSNVLDNGRVSQIVSRYRQAGKLWNLASNVVAPEAPLAWALGYPYRRADKLSWAVSKMGVYVVQIKQGGTVLLNESQQFNGIDDRHELTVDPTKECVVSVGSLTATVPANTPSDIVPITAGRLWVPGQNRKLFLGVNANAAPTVTLTGPVSITRTLSEFEVTFAGVNYRYRFIEESMPDGLYTIHIADGFDTFDGSFSLGVGTAGQAIIAEGAPGTNQPPTVVTALANQTAVVGTAFSFGIPSGTFADSDGVIASVMVSGIPTGLAYDPTSRVVSGSPTAAGTYTVTVTATDDDGATVSASFTLTMTGGNAPPPTGSLAEAIGTAPAYDGTIDWSISHQSDTNVLDVEVAEVRSDGFLRYRNKATGKNPNNGRSLIYQVENAYVDDIDNKFYSPDYPVLFKALWVNMSTPRYAWQDWGFLQYGDYVRATSLINAH